MVGCSKRQRCWRGWPLHRRRVRAARTGRQSELRIVKSEERVFFQLSGIIGTTSLQPLEGCQEDAQQESPLSGTLPSRWGANQITKAVGVNGTYGRPSELWKVNPAKTIFGHFHRDLSRSILV